MPDATTAETWLRNAPAGRFDRSVSDSAGMCWRWDAELREFVNDSGDGVRWPEWLPPGTYTLNCREGMQLDAAEAWDYLAGVEGRRCVDGDGDVWRVVGGALQYQELSFNSSEWSVFHGDIDDDFAPYTIAPDEPATIGHDEEYRGNPPGPPQALGALADALPVDQEADNRTTRLLSEQRESRKLARTCCREAGERVAELERARELDASKVEALRKEVRQVEEKHAFAISTLITADRKAQRLVVERDAAIAERDAKQRCLDEIAEALRFPTGQFVENAQLLVGLRDERDKLRAEVERLKAEIADLPDELDVALEEANQAELARLHEEGGMFLKRGIELLGLDEDAVMEDILFGIRRLKGELEAARSHAITLPTDTTTPLDLAQRAVALMGGRWVALLHDFGPQKLWFDGKGIRDELNYVSAGTVSLLWCPKSRVTLAPEPEPARRKLSFGDAVELGRGRGGVVVAAWNKFRMRGCAAGVYIELHDSVTGEWLRAAITPAMLAAEWEAVDTNEPKR